MPASQRFQLPVVIGLALLASGACASPDRGGPPGGRGGRPDEGPRAQSEGKMAKPVALLFTGMDTDQDLTATTDELAAGIHTEWLRLDSDNNGVATGFEIADWAAAVLGDPDAEPGRLAFDHDFSLTVTPQEFETGLRRQFAQADRNGDGILSRAELLMQIQTRGGAGSGGGQGGGQGRGGRGQGGPGGGGPGGGFPGG